MSDIRAFAKRCGYRAYYALQACLDMHANNPFDLVVDYGCGRDFCHARIFAEYGIPVQAYDLFAPPPKLPKLVTYLDSLLLDFRANEKRRGEPRVDRTLVWCSHTLEHCHDPIDKLVELRLVSEGLQPRGSAVLAVTVPPAKPQIVGGHVNLYNAGLLLYQMALAGIRTDRASVLEYGYNITVIVELSPASAELPTLAHDAGDVAALRDAGFLPEFATEGFNGDIDRWNWPPKA